MVTVEEWRPIPGFGGAYEVSNLGRILSRKQGKERILKTTSFGHYPMVILQNGKEKAGLRVHRAVLCAFLREPLPGEVANHKDFNRENNSIENLEWISRADNNRHAAAAGRMSKKKRPVAVVREVQHRVSSGELLHRIAAELGMDLSVAYKISRRLVPENVLP